MHEVPHGAIVDLQTTFGQFTTQALQHRIPLGRLVARQTPVNRSNAGVIDHRDRIGLCMQSANKFDSILRAICKAACRCLMSKVSGIGQPS
jgi:hypothetical protein